MTLPAGVGLAHRRLAIIDLSPLAAQFFRAFGERPNGDQLQRRNL